MTGSDKEEDESNESAYEQLLKLMSSRKGRIHGNVLRKRKRQLQQMAHTETEDRRSEFEDVELLDQVPEESSDIGEAVDEEQYTDDESGSDEDEVRSSDLYHLARDPFKVHFEQDLPSEVIETIKTGQYIQSEWQNGLSSLTTTFNYDADLPIIERQQSGKLRTLTDLKVVQKLSDKWEATNKRGDGPLSPLQLELFHHINNYQDIMCTQRTFTNGEEVRALYCLHAVNHVLKTRSRILKNNEKLAKSQEENAESEEYRDHGLTRPKVLIVVPFREACLRVVNQIIKLSLSMDGKAQVMQKKRFYDEYKDTTEDKRPSASYVPDDFKAMFAGNIDDCFRIGITVLRRAVRLFSDFYSSDIIVASPLGLRTIIGAEGESERDFDFLSSIEVLIMDQTDVFLMQNWEHVLHFLDHMHLQPKTAHDTDFSRVRLWTLNGWSPYYRQTMIFSSVLTPEINHLFNKYCQNYSGKVKIRAGSCLGSIQQVVSQIPQVFHRVDCDDHLNAADWRFDYFVKKILPEFRGKLTSRTGIFIPSYFDFVRLRNYFKKNDVSFFQINEYSERANISRSRALFNQGKRQFLIFTERFYFFYRYRLKGMRRIIFYELPQYPIFYSEILNFLQTGTDTAEKAAGTSCTVLYSKFDGYKMENIVGTTRSRQMLSSKKKVHMLVSGGQ